MAAAEQGMVTSGAGEGLAERERRRSIGRLAGALYMCGAALALPSALLADPPPRHVVYLIMAIAFGTGVVLSRVPWHRISAAWLHVISITGVIEITAGIWVTGVHGSLYAWLYMLVAIGAAYSFRSRKTVIAYLAFVSAAMALPLIDPPVSTVDTLLNMLVSIPSLVIAGGVVTYFRERLEAGQHAYKELARLDPLTGVGNYRTLHERLEYEIGRHERHGRRFAVTLIDLDDFKRVNETYGHLQGDRVLRDVGRVLSLAVRDEDTVARQGGDEFSVLAPEAGLADAELLAARVRSALSLVATGDCMLTAHIGFAIYPDDGTTADELLTHADAGLLGTKRTRQRRAKTSESGAPATTPSLSPGQRPTPGAAWPAQGSY